jgi:hypothetical protein
MTSSHNVVVCDNGTGVSTCRTTTSSSGLFWQLKTSFGQIYLTDENFALPLNFVPDLGFLAHQILTFLW